MRIVNISELKARLSAHIQLVRDGEEVLVCDRNKPVARIVPSSAQGRNTALALLLANDHPNDPTFCNIASLAPTTLPRRCVTGWRYATAGRARVGLSQQCQKDYGSHQPACYPGAPHSVIFPSFARMNPTSVV